MASWQDGVAILIASLSAFFVIRDIIRPFMQRRGCGRCGGCDGGQQETLNILPAKK